MRYDVVVVGGGPGGYACAIRLSQLGAKTLLVEKDELGGECTNWGCIPSKHLITQAHKIWAVKELSIRGIVEASISVDLSKLSQATASVVQKLRQGIAYLLKAYGVTVMKGEATLEKPGEVFVTTKDGQGHVEARNVVVATGTEPATLQTIPTDQNRVIDYRRALFLDSVPKRLLVVGGGAIGLELGTAYAHLGSEVVITEIMDQLLPGFDADAARLIKRSLEKKGVKIYLQTTVQNYSYVGDKVDVSLSNGVDEKFDYVLVSVGKRASAWVRHLADVGVELDAKGFVKTDDKMATSVNGIYAVGDVTGPPFLAHKAYRQAVVAAESIMGLNSRYDGLTPFGVFTSPEVAFVGLSSSEAKNRGLDVVETRFPYAALGRAVADGEDGFVKLVADAASDVLLGAVVVGPHATEIIAVVTNLIKAKTPLENAAEAIYVHPTYSESLGEAIHLLHRRAIHYVSR